MRTIQMTLDDYQIEPCIGRGCPNQRLRKIMLQGKIKGDDGEKLTYLPFKTATFIHAPGRKHARVFPSTRLFVRAAAAC